MIVFNDMDTKKSAFSEYIQNYRSLDWTKGHTLAHHLHTRPNQIPTRLSEPLKKGYLNPHKQDKPKELGIWYFENSARDIILAVIQQDKMKKKIIENFLINKKNEKEFISGPISHLLKIKDKSGFVFIKENTDYYKTHSNGINYFYTVNGKIKIKHFNFNQELIKRSILKKKYVYTIHFTLHYEERIKEFWLETAYPNLNF